MNIQQHTFINIPEFYYLKIESVRKAITDDILIIYQKNKGFKLQKILRVERVMLITSEYKISKTNNRANDGFTNTPKELRPKAIKKANSKDITIYKSYCEKLFNNKKFLIKDLLNNVGWVDFETISTEDLKTVNEIFKQNKKVI